MKEKLVFFIGNEEFDYTIEQVGERFVGKTTFDVRLNCEAKSAEEVKMIVENRILQLRSGN